MTHHKLSPQKQYIISLLQGGDWVCSNRIDPKIVRDFRKRISECNQEGFIIKSEVCDKKLEHNHRAGVHKYRLEGEPTRTIYTYDLNESGVRVPRAVIVSAV